MSDTPLEGAGIGTPAGPVDRLAPDGPDEMGRELFAGPAAVRETLRGLAPALSRLRGELDHAARLVLVGTGASLAVARVVAPLWRGATRAPVVVRESSAVVFGDLDGDQIAPTDAVVVISKSGSSPETVAAAARAGETGARVLALTAARESPLAERAISVIWTPIGEENGAATKSELSAAAALMALAGVLDPTAVDALVAQLEAVASDWSWAADLGPRLAATRHLWLLGFGCAHGAAEAGALLWHEKAHRPAVATTPSEFRHGPIETATDVDAVIVVERLEALDAETAYLDLLVAEVSTVGALLVRVAPPAADEPQRALGSLLRLQQLARATAHAAGSYQDGFRVLREIVRAATL